MLSDQNLGATIEVASGTTAVRASLESLLEQAVPWNQEEEVKEALFFLSTPFSPTRRPLLAVLRAGTLEERCTIGAVFLWAHGSRVFGERLLGQTNRTGRRCVFGPTDERTEIAAAVASALIRRGAASIALSYRISGPVEAESLAFLREHAFAQRHMQLSKDRLQWQLSIAIRAVEWPIKSTLGETLVGVGKRTRRNLRAAWRLCQRDAGAELVWDPELSASELQNLNRMVSRPVRRDILEWRVQHYVQANHAFLVGLRTADGQWMALAGGQRSGSHVSLDWQMNSLPFARFSISLVMRGLLAEYFGAGGATAMSFDGGTAHQLKTAFRTGLVTTLRVRNGSWWIRTLERSLVSWFPRRANTRSLFPSVHRKRGDWNE